MLSDWQCTPGTIYSVYLFAPESSYQLVTVNQGKFWTGMLDELPYVIELKCEDMPTAILLDTGPYGFQVDVDGGFTSFSFWEKYSGLLTPYPASKPDHVGQGALCPSCSEESWLFIFPASYP